MRKYRPLTRRPGVLREAVAVALALAAAAPFAASAQSRPAPDAGRALADQQRGSDATIAPRQPAAQLERKDPSSEVARVPSASPSSPSVRVERFNATEDIPSGIDPSKMRAALAPFEGRELDLAGIEAAAQALADLYRSAGFFLAQVVVPPQEVAEGVVELRATLGRLGEVEVLMAPGSRMPSSRARAILSSRAKPGSSPSQADIERGLLLLGDVPGMSARGTIGPGAEPGTARLDARVDESRVWEGLVEADNYGNRYTGAGRVGIQVNLNDPLGLGDAGYARVQKSSGMESVNAGYSLLAGDSGLRLGVSGQALRYRLGGAFESLGARGTAREMGVNASYPLIRQRGATLSLSGSVVRRSLSNEANGAQISDKELNMASATLSAVVGDYAGSGGVTQASATLTAGRVDLSRDAADQAADSVFPRTAGGYRRLSYALSRVQGLTSSVDLVGRVSGQWASGNLDSSEQLSLGGPFGVRGYPVGEAYGDEGILATAEARWAFAPQWRSALFVDAGRIRARKDPDPASAGPNSYGLASVGASIEAALAGGYNAKLMLAKALGANPGRSVSGANADGRSRSYQAWIVVGRQF